VVFEPINQRSTIIALDYQYNIFDFTKYLTETAKFKGYSFKQVPLNFQTNSPDKEEAAKHIASIPIVSFKSEKIGIDVTLNGFENKLDIVNDNFDPSNTHNYTDIAYNLIQSRLSLISAFGINFISNFEFNKKLKLLNPDVVDTIKDFSKNLTFQLVLPIEYADYTVTYKVQKLIPEVKNANRIYQIDANFHIDLADKDIEEKLSLFKGNLSNLKGNLYQIYYERCQEFLSLHYEE